MLKGEGREVEEEKVERQLQGKVKQQEPYCFCWLQLDPIRRNITAIIQGT